MLSDLKKMIIICGPTASGKTRVGIELARKYGGEIISADSQQVWREFDIGTAKATREEREEVPHHLIDVVSADQTFDASRFVELADVCVDDICRRKKIPFVVGGTGLYVKALEKGLGKIPPRDEELRKKLLKEAELHGIAKLHERLSSVDPESAEKIKPNDKTRVIRALEVFKLTGEKQSSLHKTHAFAEKRYNALKIGLNVERKELYARIDARVDKMIERGFVDEVRGLLKKYSADSQAFSAVGYREIAKHLAGEKTLEDAVALTKQQSRNYAKRQMTWFRADPEIVWLSPDDILGMIRQIDAFLK